MYCIRHGDQFFPKRLNLLFDFPNLARMFFGDGEFLELLEQ